MNTYYARKYTVFTHCFCASGVEQKSSDKDVTGKFDTECAECLLAVLLGHVIGPLRTPDNTAQKDAPIHSVVDGIPASDFGVTTTQIHTSLRTYAANFAQ
jgi:hypothetical protein